MLLILYHYQRIPEWLIQDDDITWKKVFHINDPLWGESGVPWIPIKMSDVEVDVSFMLDCIGR